MRSYDGDPDEFVQENMDTLVRILKHSDNEFVRALALKAITKYGNEPQMEAVEREIRKAFGENGEDL